MSNLAELAFLLPPAQWCRCFFVLAAAGVLTVASLPRSLRELLLTYGARGSSTPSVPNATAVRDRPSNRVQDDSFSSRLDRLVQMLTSFGQVPHWLFATFYVSSLLSSAFWAWEWHGLRHGGAERNFLADIARLQARAGEPSMTLSQVVMVWAMMAFQGARRLKECVIDMKPSSSKMWFVHWLLGVGFYLAMGISIWIEGPDAILQPTAAVDWASLFSTRAVVAMALFAFASVKQQECHKHLAGLRKYSLPGQGMFRYFVCPHYTCECLLYVSIAIAAAPEGDILNRTILCGLIFVSINLGATARETKQWYIQKFGAEQVASRWVMIPFIF